MGVMMEFSKVTSKDGYFEFDGDMEKGEVNLKVEGGCVYGINTNTVMEELQCHTATNGGIENGNPWIDSSSDDHSESERLVDVDKKVLDERKNRGVGRKVVKEKPKEASSKKHPKPPRPPRGLSLDSADQKFVREIHELARVKRARVERMKALKKAKEAKKAFSMNQIFATLLTVLFCLVLLLQGISSRTSTTTYIRETSSSQVAKRRSIISVKHNPVSSVTNLNGLGSESPRLSRKILVSIKQKRAE